MRAPDGLEWLAQAEVAARLSIPEGRVRQWVSRRRVRSVRVDGRRYVCWQDAVVQERRGREDQAVKRRAQRRRVQVRGRVGE